jgi:hypothetical protein
MDLTVQTQGDEGKSTSISNARVRAQTEWFTEIKCQRGPATDLVSLQSQQAMKPVAKRTTYNSFQQRVSSYVTADLRRNDFTVQLPNP